MKRRYPNIEKIKKLMAFDPSCDLLEMIQSVIDYYKE